MKNTLLNHKYTLDSIKFINRESSLLEFQKRVLAQAEGIQAPLLERLRFLCIVTNNLDEFFEVRIAGIKEQIAAGSSHIDGIPIQTWFKQISANVRTLTLKKYTLLDEILPLLEHEGIYLKTELNWSTQEKIWLEDFFIETLLPLLTPIALDVAHPFPHIENKGLSFIINLDGNDMFDRPISTAILPIPRNLPRIIQLPESLCGSTSHFILLRNIIHAFMDKVFLGAKIIGVYQFRVTRNSHLFIDDEESKNLRTVLQGELEQRHFGKAVRLEVSARCPDHLIEFLSTQFDLKEVDIYRISGMINPTRLNQLFDLVDRPDLQFPSFVARYPKVWSKVENAFSHIRNADILLHHPFECFTPVVELLQAAAIDPKVQAIRMTVYRTGTDSALMQELVKAAKNGIEVNVVVEIMARFDEATNISWATQLEQAGAKIVYGIFGLKTHAKMLLIIRKELDIQQKPFLKYYTHIGTGNYHPRTAKLYTDFGLITANAEIGHDVAAIFLSLSSLGQAPKLKHLWQAPFSLYNNLILAINKEISAAQAGLPAKIIAKMNALLEPLVIEALYKASQAGVKIDLIIRGTCALRPNVIGLSENIRVFSIVGRFLEHTRIFYFYNNSAEDVYLSSADWMNRNLFRRIEIAVPILDLKIKRRIIKEGLRVYLSDNQQSFELNGNDSSYTRRKQKGRAACAQTFLLNSERK